MADALEWGEYVIKRRYEWVEIISGALGTDKDSGDEGKVPKPCSNPVMCSMCNKNCRSRSKG